MAFIGNIAIDPAFSFHAKNYHVFLALLWR